VSQTEKVELLSTLIKTRAEELSNRFFYSSKHSHWKNNNRPTSEEKIIKLIRQTYDFTGQSECEVIIQVGQIVAEIKNISLIKEEKQRELANEQALIASENAFVFPDVKLIKNKEGEIIGEKVKANPENVKYLLNKLGLEVSTDAYKGTVSYNADELLKDEEDKRSEFDKQKDIQKLINFAHAKCVQYDIPNAERLATLAVVELANNNVTNPMADYINKLDTSIKDEAYIDAFLKDVFRLSDDYQQERVDFIFEMIKKWFIQAVAAWTTEEGYDAYPLTLVLTGGQNIGKSTLVKKLLPYHLSNYVGSEKTLSTSDKDSRIELLSYALVELGEIGSSFRKSDQESLKSFLTSPYDEYRRPYARASEKHKRKTVFISTNNNEKFLIDATGSRRFISVKLHPNERSEFFWERWDINKVWSQFKILKEEGYSFTLTREEAHKLTENNNKSRVKSNIEVLFEKYIDVENSGALDVQRRNQLIIDRGSQYLDTLDIFTEILRLDFLHQTRRETDESRPRFVPPRIKTKERDELNTILKKHFEKVVVKIKGKSQRKFFITFYHPFQDGLDYILGGGSND
jgi:predicted P-loop ATPase